MNLSFLGRSFALSLTIGFASLSAYAGDWPTFRGSDRTGISKDTGLLESWPEEGPKLVWEAKGAGRGYASPAIAGDKIYTLGDGLSTADDKAEYLTCYDRKTGKQLWKSKTGNPWTEGSESWQSSRSTPTVDGDSVYVMTPFGDLISCATSDGSVQWKKNMKTDFGGKTDPWGYSESVLVDGDMLVCTPGGEKGTMVALQKKNGEVIWQCDRPENRCAGHSSIVISNVGGQKIYVQSTGSGPMGVSAKDGVLLWSYAIDKTTSVIPTPIVRDEYVFFVAGYGRGGALLKQVPGGDGSVKIEEVYGLKPELGNKHGGVVLIGDYLYGDSDDRGNPYCAKLMDGSIQWKGRGAGKNSAAVTAADGKLYFRYASGVMTLVDSSPSEFKEISHFEAPGSGERPSWAHPVVLDGMMYLREGDSILCYDVRKN
jgi:outer membrane protein assembly factor BamB